MSSFQELIERLAAWLARPSAWHGVDIAASKEHVLRAMGTGPALARVLHDASHARLELLVGALTRQAQRSPAPAWSAALVIACRTWLERIARRFESEAMSQDDGNSLVVVAFLDVVCRLRPRRRVSPAWLKVQTQRRVISWLRGRGALEGGRPDERHRTARAASGRARVRALRVARVAGGRP
ncbi:MAG: hypothetical protein HS111_09850 [Kofleriaceae bacterium]|nr:hypothetical protein [Kofleriaceae bacterium]